MKNNKLDKISVKSVKADGVLGEFSYAVEYPAITETDRMRLIYAPNGRGKTNFLRAVSAALTPTPESFRSLIEIPFSNLQILFDDESTITIDRGDEFIGQFTASVSAEPTGERHSLEVDPVEFGSRIYRRMWETRSDFSNFAKAVGQLSPGAIFIGDDRLSPLTPEEEHDSVRNEAHSYASPRRRHGSVSRLLERVERMFTKEALAGLSAEGEHTGIYSRITESTLAGSSQILASEARTALEDQINTLLERGRPLARYGLLSMRQVEHISDQIAAARANDKNLRAVHTVLTPYFESLSDQVTALAPAQKLIDTYVTSINHFLDRTELKFSASQGIQLIGRDGQAFHPDSLSSGERHLLLLLSQAVLATVVRPLVIIDEPEISLGIEWQRDLLPELLRCTETGDVQFLIASHSLQVMNAGPREDIVRPSEVR